MKNAILIFMFIISLQSLYAQVSKKEFDVDNIKITFSVNVTFNDEDLNFGFSPGIYFIPDDLTFNLIFSMRPFEKKLLIEKFENYYIRFFEKRFLIGLGVDKQFFINERFGISFNGGFGYTFGYYPGSKANADADWIPIMGFGIVNKLNDNISMKVGYQIAPVPHVNRNQIVISFIF